MALLASYVYVARAQSSTAEYIGKIQALARELNSKAANLDKARETAKESTDAFARRHQELEALRTETRALRVQCALARDELRAARSDRDAARKDAAALRARVDEDARARAKLEKDVAAAQTQHWELVSRLHHDERARLSALNRLRRPPALLYPSSDDERASSAPSSAAAPVAPVVAVDRALAKTPSESHLLSLQPDLSASDSDDDFDESFALMPPVAAKRASVAARTASAPARRTAAQLSLLRPPWVDSLSPALQHASTPTQSVADILNGRAGLTPGVIAFRGGVPTSTGSSRPPAPPDR